MVKLQQDPLIGSVLDGSYEVLSLIGHGGMGVVYKARHKLMDRIVAIKMLKSTLISDSMSVKRFQQEVRASARIDHPHAITVYNFGISPEGLPYIVMDYLEGLSLADVIKAEGHIEVDRGVKIISQACEALSHAHKQGVVHRDLKPSNIVLTNYDDDPDFVKVVDFGVAKLMGGAAEGAQRLTQTGEVCGSPVYMSPEQCMGQELDLRSDIYSMGVVIYETLTGKLPLIGRTMVDTMSKHVSEMPPTFLKMRPDLYIPERLEQVVFKAMAKDPVNRHQSMEELREDLEYAIPKPNRGSALRQTQAASSTMEPARGGVSRNTFILFAVVTAAFFAAGATLFSVVHNGMWSPAPVALQVPAGGAKQPEANSSGAASGPTTGDTIRPGDHAGKTETSSSGQPATTSSTAASSSGNAAGASSAGTAVRAVAAAHKPVEQAGNAFTPQHKTLGEVVLPRVEHKQVMHKTVVHETPRAHPVKKAPKAAGGTTEADRFNKLRMEIDH